MKTKDLLEISEAILELKRDKNLLLHALVYLKKGSCWCDCGIDNPMMSGVHSEACRRVSQIVKDIK